jgi:oligopeptidase B
VNKFNRLLILLFIFCLPLLAQTPPVAKKIPKVDSLFGDMRVDNYFWLRNPEDTAVIDYLKAENAYTEAVMKPTEKMQAKLYNEMRSRIKESDMSVPEKIDDYFYYTKTVQGQQYAVYCRKKGDLKAPEEVLLDENMLAKGRSYFEIAVYRVSPRHDLLAYVVDTTGAEEYTLYIKDLTGDSLYHETIAAIEGNVQWANDDRTLFYITLDPAWRPYRLYRHVLDAPDRKDDLLYQEDDERFFLGIGKTRSRKFLLMNLESKTATEYHYLDADHPQDSFRVILPRAIDVEYYVEHNGDNFYFLTNDNAKNFRLVEAPVAQPDRARWRELIPASDTIYLEGFDAFRDHLTVYERHLGLPQLRVIDLRTGASYHAEFPEPVYAFWPARNPDFNTSQLRINYMSMVTPLSVYDYDLAARTRELKKQTEVIGYRPEKYQTERVFATAPDGARIPVALVFRKDLKKNGQNPLLLDGYGAYGGSSDPYFSSNRLSLLDRGFVYALAQIRGGGEMGRTWYEQGKLLNKKNTFTDFIACAEFLVQERYTSADRLCIEGGSAGGLLIGSVVNLNPGLFRAAIADVPFVDVLNTMLDPTIPLTVTEYEEWGNPNLREYYDYIKSYAPYENVKAQNYPNLLVTAGLNDPRVGFWEPAKWTAKLRALKTDQNLLILKTNLIAGHGGVTGRFEYLKEIAFEYAFLFRVLGITR